jgi:hypothetical protein
MLADLNAERGRATADQIGRRSLDGQVAFEPCDVADPAAVRRQWYGDRLIEYRCLGKPVPESPYCYAPDGSNNEPIEAYIGGTRIASETGFRVVGFVTQP